MAEVVYVVMEEHPEANSLMEVFASRDGAENFAARRRIDALTQGDLAYYAVIECELLP